MNAYRMYDINGCGTLDIRIFDGGSTLRIAYEESTNGVEAMEGFAKSVQKAASAAYAKAREEGYAPK